MDRIVEKLKTNALITFILGLLSSTWIVIDYFVLDTIINEGLSKFSLEWILVIISGLAFIAFHFSAFVTIYYAFRLIRKIKSEQKKNAKESEHSKSLDAPQKEGS